MNTRQILDDSAAPLALCASFNADGSCFSVALESGFRVFSSATGDLKLARDVSGGIGCAEMLGTTNYLALVGGGRQPKFPQNKVQIWNDATERVAVAIEFKTPVQRVRLSKSHLVVALLNNVGVYRMKSPPQKIADYETCNNPYGLCCLSENLVAYPSRKEGHVKLLDLTTGNNSIIPAHESPLRAIAISPKGDMVATASETGTLIRLFAFPSCTKICEFRRGVDPATVFSLAFSPSGRMLAVTSDKSTLHIFDIPASPSTPTTEPDPKLHKWGILSKVPMLPRAFSDNYSVAAAKFELGDDLVGWGPASRSATINAGIPGVPGGRPTKGLVGWLTDETLVVVGAGNDARWEKYAVGLNADGKRVVVKEGWKKYLD